MDDRSPKPSGKSSNDETDYDESDFDLQQSELADADFQFAQIPLPSQEYSSDASESQCRSSQSPFRSQSQSPLRSSQSSYIQSSQIQNSQKGKVLFQLNEDSQTGCSQTHCSQFYCSQTDEIAFCSQSIPGCYSQLIRPIDSSACVPLYVDSVLFQVRANDIKYTPTSDIFENQKSITPLDRENRIKWMIENMIKLEVSVRAMFLCVRLFNKVISIIDMDEESVILYSIACLGLGAKFENSFAQPVSSYAELSAQFTDEEIIECEQEILLKLDFQISIPTEKFFLNFWANQIQSDEIFGMMATFISFCSFLDSRISSYPAEVVAAAIFHIAVDSYDPSYLIQPLNDTASKFGYQKIKECEVFIVEDINKVISDDDSIIKNMFSITERKSVSIDYTYDVPLDFNGIQ